MSNTNTVIISVTGLPSSVRALSCEFQLGVNQIPVAHVGIDPSSSDIITNMEAYRRKACVIRVAVGGQTLSFQCLFDGLSTNMSIGSLSYTAVFKGQFQTWLEIFPLAPGIHPAGINPLIRQEWIKMGNFTVATAALQHNIASIFGNGKSGNLADVMLYAISSVITTNITNNQPFDSDPVLAAGLLKNVILDMAKGVNNPGYKKSLEAASALISKIDTSAVTGLKVDMSKISVLNFVTNLFITSSFTNDLWSMLVHCMGILGCVLVPGFDKVYVVPECYFLKPAARITPNYREYTHTPNFASPAQYNSLNVNDNGYKDVSAVAISVGRTYNADGLSYGHKGEETSTNLFLPTCTTFYGSYPDITKTALATGGLVVLPADTIASLYSIYPISTSKEVGGNTTFKPYEAPAEAGTSAVTEAMGVNKIEENTKNMLNNLAQAKFLGLKYGDRTGSINLLFSSSWVPGTTGTAFSRRPSPNGLFTDFYVTQVRHVFSAGSALTQVSFAGARTGAEPVGISEFLLYGYTSSMMVSMQNKFIADISK